MLENKIYLNYDGIYCGMDKEPISNILNILGNPLILPLNGVSSNFILHCLYPFKLEIQALFGKYPHPSDVGFNKSGKKVHLTNHGNYYALSSLGGGVMKYNDFLLSRIVSSGEIIFYDFLEAIFEDMVFIRDVRYIP